MDLDYGYVFLKKSQNSQNSLFNGVTTTKKVNDYNSMCLIAGKLSRSYVPVIAFLLFLNEDKILTWLLKSTFYQP